MKLSILIPCLESRHYAPLIKELQHQAFRFVGDVEVLWFVDDGTLTSGTKRNHLTREAKGEYIAFVDDDDFVSANYIRSLLEGIKSNADVISFNMARHAPKFSEMWVLDSDEDKPGTGHMSSNHLCAWKKSVATKVAWSDKLGYADDQLWYRPLLKICKPSRYHINEVLYTYCFSPEAQSNHDPTKIEFARNYFGHGLRVFSDSGEIFIEEHDGEEVSPTHVIVRDRYNNIHRRHLGSLIPELICRIS